jgi:hypothetical protein
MTPDEAMAITKATCPDCGSGFSDRPHNRRGWFYAECGRRYHVGRGEWEPMAPTGCLSRQLSRLRSDLAAARGVIERLPKTADGVPVVPGMNLWTATYRADNGPWACGVLAINHESHNAYELVVRDADGNEDEVEAGWCYSTREAAEQAAKAAGGSE